jgi:hypothetical protein
MKRIKEPIDIDFSIKSKPWTEQELSDFRVIMQTLKSKNAIRKRSISKIKSRQVQIV